MKIIVAGGSLGLLGTLTSNVETLKLGDEAWSDGPELPDTIAAAASLEPEELESPHMMIGGMNKFLPNITVVDSIHYFDENEGWKSMTQKLTMGRYFHTAVLVPSSFASCNND